MTKDAARLIFQQTQQELNAQLDDLSAPKNAERSGVLAKVFSVITLFELAASQLYRLRRVLRSEDPFLESAEDSLANASQRILSAAQLKEKSGGYKEFVQRYRALWRHHIGLFWVTCSLFVGTLLLGWIIATAHPEYVSVILDQAIMERIISKNAWFESLNDNPLSGGLSIAWNNIRVSINAFIGSAILGVGGLLILAFNGIMIGTTMGFCYQNGFHEPLAEFVLAHGPLELTIIVASTFAGLTFGRIFFMRPYSLFAQRMKNAGREAGVILTGILPWLLLAGLVESFISPNPAFEQEIKIAIGALIAAAFWVWTFWETESPVKTSLDA